MDAPSGFIPVGKAFTADATSVLQAPACRSLARSDSLTAHGVGSGRARAADPCCTCPTYSEMLLPSFGALGEGRRQACATALLQPEGQRKARPRCNHPKGVAGASWATWTIRVPCAATAAVEGLSPHCCSPSTLQQTVAATGQSASTYSCDSQAGIQDLQSTCTGAAGTDDAFMPCTAQASDAFLLAHC